MVTKGMHLAWIVVSDLKKAKKFFSENLGLKIMEDHPEHNWVELAGEEGVRLGIAQESDHSPITPGQNAILTITVADLTKTKAQLQKKGVKMLGDICEVPGHVKLQLFQDNDGNKFQLVEDLSNGM